MRWQSEAPTLLIVEAELTLSRRKRFALSQSGIAASLCHFLDPSSEMIFGPANLSVDEFRVYHRPLTPAALARLTGLPPGEDLSENVEVQYLYVR